MDYKREAKCLVRDHSERNRVLAQVLLINFGQANQLTQLF
jgi:hypothetical protein